ncbi:DUF7530 family protein [Halobaculum magnesiiphilum]|uniref:Uncharacterized protein n=1 Tax=Halobaculum magnesiiphilum TaxID=1017351 RepID=A0A8T8WGR5_9EURY|nr:hypothetical protein [Halobaculum magnesiiphilum]QZP39062.1 hypothetical protein K6T50_08060 [Halobaculum magnesiiphilum]
MRADFGDAWVYESIVGAVPGAALSAPVAVGLQIVVFEAGILALAAAYDLWDAVPVGTVAVGVAAVGSLLMLTLGDENRTLDVSPRYYRLLFGSSIEVVLAVLAFSGVVTHLFVVDPAAAGPPAVLLRLLPVAVAPAGEPIVAELFGERPPAPAVFLALVVVWDLCYRIGTSWWTAIVSLYRELRLECGAGTRPRFRRLDALNVGFAFVQLALVPFVADRPVLLAALVGHVVAVTVVSGAAIALSLAAE